MIIHDTNLFLTWILVVYICVFTWVQTFKLIRKYVKEAKKYG